MFPASALLSSALQVSSVRLQPSESSPAATTVQFGLKKKGLFGCYLSDCKEKKSLWTQIQEADNYI